MKTNIIHTLLAVLIISFSKAQLSGIATLNGQSDHSGIKVKFIAAAATSITDSTTTNSSGAYSFNISGGLYKIEFSKTGYQSVFYNNNGTVILTNTVVLNNVSLNPGTIVNVNGNVSGNWTSNNIYIVQGNLTIPLGSTLNIQPGTQIKFNGNYTLTADGILNAVGSAANRIVFTSNYNPPSPSNWNGILINSNHNQIKYCLIEYGSFGISVPQGNVTIEDNEIRYFSGYGISFNTASPSLVKNNLIHDYEHYAMTTYQSNLTIECNTIYNGGNGAIGIGDASTVKNNFIYNIGGNGITCYYISTARVENNILHDCNEGIVFGENVGNGPAPLILNNTLYSNTVAINSRGFYGHAAIVGNIISNNVKGIFQASYATATPSEVSHNLFWNNSTSNYDNVQIFGLEQIVNTNTNGDPVDSYFNVYKDPLFINNTPPYYTSNSPCLNSGNTNYSPNIGCDPSLMCSGMVLGVKENKNVAQAAVYPNPFVSDFTVSGVDKTKITTVKFYDMTGKMYELNYDLNSTSPLNIITPSIDPGIYFLEMAFSNSSKVYLRLVKE